MKTDIQVVGVFRLHDDETESGDHFRSYARVWSSLPSRVCSRTYEHEGVKIKVAANWKQVISIASESHRILQASLSASEKGLFTWVEPIPEKVCVPVNVHIKGRNRLTNYGHYPINFVYCYLYDVFTIINLCHPGAADFLNLQIPDDKYILSEKLYLSSYYMYRASADNHQWPHVGEVAIDEVVTWYDQVRSGVSQVPESPPERAIFAMLHVCRSDGRPEDLIWLFYAFEALLQTRVGENFSALFERLCLILEPSPPEANFMKKKLREMYECRSKFVHGGLRIIHPMHHEGLDGRVNDEYAAIIELSMYGIRLLLACLQKYVLANWKDVGFRTIVHQERVQK